MPAISSIETNRDTIARIRASRAAPAAIVTESTAGNATGIAATVKISTNIRVSTSGEVGRAPEERLAPGRGDDPGRFAEPYDRARVDGLARLAVDGERLPRERRLIDGEKSAVEQPQVGGHDVAEPDGDDIAGDQLGRRYVAPRARAQHARDEGEPRLQRFDGGVGFVLLQEPDRRVDREHREDDHEIFPAARERREHRRDLDHPRDRTP
jgi:hypothetical protein